MMGSYNGYMASCWWMTQWSWSRVETVLCRSWKYCVNFVGRMEWLWMIKRPNLWISMAYTRIILRCRWRKWLLLTVMCMFISVLCLHLTEVQYIPRNMHTVFALLCFVVVIHWLIFPYPSGLLHWHCGNLTIAPVPAKQPWWIWINASCEFIMNDCITTTKQSTTQPCAYFLGYTVQYQSLRSTIRWNRASSINLSCRQT